MKLRNQSSNSKEKKKLLPKVQKKIKKIIQKKSSYKKQKEQNKTIPLKRTKTIATSIKESEEYLKHQKPKIAQNKSALKRTRTITTSIKESEKYLKRQDKIAKEQKTKNLKSPGRSISPLPEKKLKKSPKQKKSPKREKSPKQKKSSSQKKSISKSIEKKQNKKKSIKVEKKDKKIVSLSQKKEKDEKKNTKTKSKSEKKETTIPISRPSIIVRQPSKLPDDPKSSNQVLQRQESKLGQPGFPTAGIIDAVFCMDTTGSMGTYLAKAQQVIEGIIKRIDDKVKGTKIDVKFGFVAYRDHPPQDNTYITKFNNLDTEENIKTFINTLDTIPGGGGDFPEAGQSLFQIKLIVMDGLMDAAKQTKWRDSTEVPQLRYIFHICDAPPHGQQEFGANSTEWNAGCPCGITSNDIAHQINLHQIHYRLIKIGTSLDKMSKVFKEKFTNFDEQSIDSANNLEIHITDMIMRELLPDF